MLVPTPIATFDTSVHSPADCSAAVCAPGAEVGSLGCLVQMDGARYVLGSAHVMIASAIAMGPGQLYQPPIDHPGYRPIAKPYAAAIAVKDGVTVNTLDAALAEVLDPKAVSAKLGGLGFPAGFRTTALAVGERVRIHGAGGRQVAFGKVQQTAFTALVDYSPWGQGLFNNLIACSPYSKPADSGSAVVDDSNSIVGIHVAGTTDISLFCPITAALALWPNMRLMLSDD